MKKEFLTEEHNRECRGITPVERSIPSGRELVIGRRGIPIPGKSDMVRNEGNSGRAARKGPGGGRNFQNEEDEELGQANLSIGLRYVIYEEVSSGYTKSRKNAAPLIYLALTV